MLFRSWRYSANPLLLHRLQLIEHLNFQLTDSVFQFIAVSSTSRLEFLAQHVYHALVLVYQSIPLIGWGLHELIKLLGMPFEK